MSRIQPFAPLWTTATATAAACLALVACGGAGDPQPGAGPAPLQPPTAPPADNQPPQISGTPLEATNVDSTWRFEPSASDADGDAMQFFVENAPPWTEFDSATGALEGTPGEGDLGVYDDVLISVTDGRGSGKYDRAAEIDNPGVTRYVVEDLGPGNSFFAVTVRTADGLESAPSAEGRKRIEG
jgi:hypothetical protein